MAIYKVNGVEVDAREKLTLSYDKVLPVGFLDDKAPEDVAKFGISLVEGKWTKDGAEVVLPMTVQRQRVFPAGALLKYDESSVLGSMFTDCGIAIEANAPKTPAPAPTLDKLKAIKKAEIEAKTYEMLAKGFIFAGKTFAAKPEAETRWMGLGTALAVGLVTYPQTVIDITGSPVSLADAAAVKEFLGTAMYYLETIVRGPARVSKKAIDDAITEAELALIEDAR